MASAAPCSGKRYKTFEARKAFVEINDYSASRGALKLIQINLACVFESGTRVRSRPAIHDGDENGAAALVELVELRLRWP
jgi:hypothetical protein